MYENVVFAVLAVAFILLAQRQKKRMIPLLTVIYRAGFIMFTVLAVTQSFSIQQTATTFTYNYTNPTVPLVSSTSSYAYANTLTNNSFNDGLIVVFGLIMLLAIIIEMVEDAYNIGMNTATRLGKS